MNIVKRVADPEIRRKQILETAMELFYKNGYENTSLDDIACELHIAKGLCYRYYDSKQTLFTAMLAQYTEECCEYLLPVLHNSAEPIENRLRNILLLLFHPAKKGKHHEFFHKKGNEVMHRQLASDMCTYLVPYVSKALSEAGYANTSSLAPFLTYALFGIWQEHTLGTDDVMDLFYSMTQSVLASSRLYAITK